MARTQQLRVALLGSLAFVVIAIASLPTLPVSGAGPYAVASISMITGEIPANLLSNNTAHLVCLTRAEPGAGNDVETRRICYTSEKPSPPPPPPPPPYSVPAIFETLAQLDQGTGVLTIPVFPCVELFPGFYGVQGELEFQLTKGGGPATGTIILTEDFTDPFDCADGVETSGPLTLTPLALSHDEDGDGCTDWIELGPTGPKGLNDPFNPNDCDGSPGTSGSLSSVSDVLIHNGTKALQFFYCKERRDHDTTTNEIKTSSVCFIDVAGQGDPNSGILADPNIDLSGPPPPPPYGNAAPFKGQGLYCPTGGCAHPVAGLGLHSPTPVGATPGPFDAKSNPYPATMGADQMVVVSCQDSVGGALGPNVINVTTINSAKASLPNQDGFIDIYYGQGIDDCNDLTPNGPPTITLPINIDTFDTPPYSASSVDGDGDGCPDAWELDKNRPEKACGDGPWNPHDSDLDFTGIFTITMELVRADLCSGGSPAGAPPIGCTGQPDKQLAAGSYFHCQADLVHDTGDNSISGKAWCYTDNPITTVNIENVSSMIDTFAGTPTPVTSVACNPIVAGGAPQDLCGDGLPGAAPPGPFADNDGLDGPGTVTGILDKAQNTLLLDICFTGVENPTQGPTIFFRVEIDAHTGIGTVDVWLNRPADDCSKPATAPSTNDAPISLGEQDDDYDVDQDGCSTTQELGSNPDLGGQRDPYNKYDHMDMNKDGAINIPDDILPISLLFGPQPGGIQGDVGFRMNGSVGWAYEEWDGVVNVPDDILGMAAQFGQNC